MISAIQELHGKGNAHGDIKPANMLICSDGQIRLCDFTEVRPRDEVFGDGEGMTTLIIFLRCQNMDYASEWDPAPVEEDDLFALGLGIWQLRKGDVPFGDVYMDDIYQMVSEEDGGY